MNCISFCVSRIHMLYHSKPFTSVETIGEEIVSYLMKIFDSFKNTEEGSVRGRGWVYPLVTKLK